ncbi:prolipoprotein diacylglyceryl transferase, partial [Mycobacterium sp. NPDC051804]|uniref:prolipoprotein diacylglyceryl transferase n=1 Tax=Mycobacterium sp. NPDC051804 TaxID=3364295 RepID=UPI0037A009F1
MTTTVLAYIPSPAQGVWHIGPVPIRAYALFIIIGIVVALVIGDRRWEARGGERGVIYDIALWAVPFGLIGGRLYHVITDWSKYFGEGKPGILGALRIWDGGLGIWGAVALGGVGAWIACRNRGIPLPAFGDAIAPGIILAQAIGRMGNYFNQELYGRPTTVPWGLEIYEREGANGVVSPDLANGVSTGQLYEVVHPTFLYELLWNVLIFALLIWVDRRFKIGHGRLFALYVAGYCAGRFWIELLRSDPATLIADIRVNSFTSTFVFIGAVVYVMVAPKGREDPATLKGKPRGESLVDEMADELVAVAATSGVVAAAKAAGQDEDEDARIEAADEHFDVDSEDLDSEQDSEIDEDTAAEAKLLAAAAAADADAEDEEAETEAEEAESGDAEEVAEDDAAEVAAEEQAEDAEADAVGGVGAVEGEDAVEAQEAAPEAHEAAVESADEAEEVAAEVAAEEEAEAPEAETEDEAESVGGVGAVEGEDAVEAQEAAPEVHEATVESADEAEEVAAEVAAEEEAEAEAEDDG